MSLLKTAARRLIRSPLVLTISLAFSIHGAATTSEDELPFNEFMRPKGTIDALSGNVAFPLEIARISGRTGGTALKLRYSSNVEVNVRADNEIAHASWVGLGWAMGFGSIRCEHGNTMTHEDDRFSWVSPEGVSQAICRKRNADGDDRFFLEKNPYWRAHPIDENDDDVFDGWELTDPSGKKYRYGLS